MNRLTFDDYAYHAWSTALFLDAPEKEQFKIVHAGFNEEVGELLTDEQYPKELTSKLWGLPVETTISEKLNKDKTAEAGDILYFISAAGLLRNITLRDIAGEAIERYTATDSRFWDQTIAGFDEILGQQMSEQVPENYRPDYRTWKMWDLAPFEDTLHILLRQPTDTKGPLKLMPDGRYALERLHSTTGRFMYPETGTKEEFTAAAALALGGLSIVLQNRFNSSLAKAATNNIEKRERRERSGALQEGIDVERSRKVGQPRQIISDEQSTENNLLNAPLPEA